jgi:hypothetical protein
MFDGVSSVAGPVPAGQLWIVEYTSLCNLRRTSFFFDETHARQFYQFCASDQRAAPTLLVSPVNFTQTS